MAPTKSWLLHMCVMKDEVLYDGRACAYWELFLLQTQSAGVLAVRSNLTAAQLCGLHYLRGSLPLFICRGATGWHSLFMELPRQEDDRQL
jgi:hypothetical protein